ncbi:unnamed protein product [Withania somnifera]
MKNAKEIPDPTLTSEKKIEWTDFIYEDREKLVIPVGPRFQVDVPDWADSQKEEMVRKYKEKEFDALKWLGTLVWPTDNNLENKEANEQLIGKGRKEHCSCEFPGSVECVKSHVKEERMKLASELETAFSAWKIDEMGEEVSNLWTTKEEKKFSSLVKTNRISKGKSFLKPAVSCLPSKTRQNIVNYYFNVHVPQRISSQTRSNCEIIDTDDEEGEEEVTTPKHSRKRNRAKYGASSSSKPAKKKYLAGRR